MIHRFDGVRATLGLLTTLIFVALASASPPVRAQDEPAGGVAPQEEPDPSATDESRPAESDAVAPDTAAADVLPDSEASMPPGELEAFVDATVRLMLDEAHIAGAAVAVVQGGTPVLSKGYGFAAFEPLRRVDAESTLFRIGSITKTFTWILLMNAVAEGRIRLDAPVNDYLPSELQVPSEGFSEPILVRHLLTHSPGFEDRALGQLFVADPSRVRPLSVFLAEERPARVYEPGRVVAYSNYGVGLAGAIVAAVEGAPWQELVEDRILRPLGLMHTTVREPYPPDDALPAPMPESLAAELSRGFRWTGVEHSPRSFDYITQIAPAGVMSASASDMARYMLMLLDEGRADGARIFGPEAAAAFRTPMTPFPSSVGSLNAGFFEFPLPGGYRGYGHDGGTLSFFTNMTLVPELELGIFVATNTEGGARLSGGLPARIIEHFYGDPEVAPAAGSIDVEEARRVYAGRYLPTRRAHGGLEGFIGRLRTLNVSVSPSGYLVIAGIAPQPVRMVPADEPDVFQPADVEAGGGALAFERENEQAARVLSVAMAFERVKGLFDPQTLAAAAVLAVLTAVATLIGFFVRLAHRAPARAVQRLGGGLQVSAALAWLVSVGAFAAWAARATDVTQVFYDWPGALLLTASWAAVAASVLTAAMLLVWPFALLTSSGAAWSRWRKLRYTATLAVFAAFAVILGLWGALQPWLE